MTNHYYYRKAREKLHSIKVEHIYRSSENKLFVVVNSVRHKCDRISDIIPYEFHVEEWIEFDLGISSWAGYIVKNHATLAANDDIWRIIYKSFNH